MTYLPCRVGRKRSPTPRGSLAEPENSTDLTQINGSEVYPFLLTVSMYLRTFTGERTPEEVIREGSLSRF